MKTLKTKYYSLDDKHEIVTGRAFGKPGTAINKLTKGFFAKRRCLHTKKTIKSK